MTLFQSTMILRSLLRPLTPSIRRCIRTVAEAELEAEEILEALYAETRSQRFRDIVVIKTKFDADPRYLLLANAFSSRHLVNGTETINKQYKNLIKKPNQDFAQLSISQEWNVLDFHSVVLHLFLEDCRKHYDIEQLWTVGEKYDDLVLGKTTSADRA